MIPYRRSTFIERTGEWIRPRIGSYGPLWLKRLYQEALMLQTAGRGIASELPLGEVVRALPAFRHMSWNPHEYRAFRSAVRPGQIALDIGANVGAYSVLLGHWVGRSGAVFAFEPSPAAFEGLTGHIRLNRLDGIVHPMAAAIGDMVGPADFRLASTSGHSRIAIDGDGESVITVPMTTIDDFCATNRLEPDFIKIDVEGFELEVLRGAREVIRAKGRSLALFVEMHPAIWPLLNISKRDILDELGTQSLHAVGLAPGLDPWSFEGPCARLQPV